MRSETEIRAHIANLLKCRNRPCDCGAEGHAVECFAGGRMMDATIDALRWVLGEGDYQRIVDGMRRFAQGGMG